MDKKIKFKIGKREIKINHIVIVVSCISLLMIMVIGVAFAVLRNDSSEVSAENVTVNNDAPTKDVNTNDTEQTSEAEQNTQSQADETNVTQKNKDTYVTEKISDIEALDATSTGWGQGVHFDGENRPLNCINNQEEYGKYNAYYIGEDKKTIYLTFDEGYENGYTAKILDVLKEKNVKAVFFVTKPYAKSNPELVQRMIDEGHDLGNHSITHPSEGMPSLSIEKQQSEINGCHQYIKENFNYDMHLFRFPTGRFSEQSLAIVNNCNYKSVFWSFAYADFYVDNQPERGAALEKLTQRLHPGAIYLLHAVSETNTNILGDFIDQGRAAGYTFDLFK